MTYEELVTSGIYKWRDAKGKGTLIIPQPIDSKFIILATLQLVFIKNKNIAPIIVCKNSNDVLTLTNFLTTREYEENNKFFRTVLNSRQLKIYTTSITKNLIVDKIDLLIYYNLEDIDDNTLNLTNKAHFILGVFERVIRNTITASKLYVKAPPIEYFTQKQLTAARLSSPVEEMLIDVAIPEDSEDLKLLNYYNEYIATSLSIFGDLDTMNIARTGDVKTNISSTQICRQIAENNGWNERLDMSIPFNQKLDATFNPINIRDRANGTFEIIRKRSDLVSSNKCKLDAILKIVNDNPTAKILIISKKGEFASVITDYINKHHDKPICGNYHDKVEPIAAVDSLGKPILYKTGAKKGQQRYYGADAQKSNNLLAFNDGFMNILSAANAPDKDLSCNIDIVIITSPLCSSIESYIYRLSSVRFAIKLKMFTIYIKNSLEKEKIISRSIPQNHVVINPIKSEIVENNSDFVIVD